MALGFVIARPGCTNTWLIVSSNTINLINALPVVSLMRSTGDEWPEDGEGHGRGARRRYWLGFRPTPAEVAKDLGQLATELVELAAESHVQGADLLVTVSILRSTLSTSS